MMRVQYGQRQDPNPTVLSAVIKLPRSEVCWQLARGQRALPGLMTAVNGLWRTQVNTGVY